MIDEYRLAADRGYWDSVAPEGAVKYYPETNMYEAVWVNTAGEVRVVRNCRDRWSGQNNRVEGEILRPEPVPTKDELPPSRTVCELWVGGVFDDVVEFIGVRNKYTAVFWRLEQDVPDAGELPTVDFRPIRSEEDRMVDKMKYTFDTCGSELVEDGMRAIYREFIKKENQNERQSCCKTCKKV